MINAGRLREFVTIQRGTETPLSDGSTSVVYNTLLTTYCDVKQRTASIDVVGAQDNIAQRMIFTMRYRTNIPFEIGDRLIWRERNFKIHSFEWDVLRTKLEISCNTHNESTSDGNPGS